MSEHRSPLPDVPIRRISITDRLFEGLRLSANRVALIDGPSGASFTGAALEDRIRRFAGGLRAEGVGPGTVIAILAPNHPDYVVAFHGVALAGATVTTLNPTYTAPEVAHQLRDSGATLLISIPQFLDTAKAGAEGTGVREIVTIGAADGHRSLDDLLGPSLSAQVPVDLETHVLALPYSSGTTGLPKGVMLSHRNMVVNVEQALKMLEVRPDETTVAFLPFFHIYGMTALMNLYLGHGAALVTMPRFDLQAFLTHVQTHRAERVFIAPPVAIALAKHPLVDQFDLASLKVIMSAAAPLGVEVSAEVERRLGCKVIQGYGMTELSPITHVAPAGDPRHGSVGVTAPNTVTRIVNPETLQDCGPGEEGEVWIKGPQVMLGYLNRPEATAAMIQDGWLRTGDLGVFDADGYLFIRDRLKELIKVKGFQVAPAEVEGHLLGLAGVADAAVIGVPDEEAGERALAFVVRQAGSTIDTAALIAGLKPFLASYKLPKDVIFVEAVPKSASGKILRRVLRDGLASTP